MSTSTKGSGSLEGRYAAYLGRKIRKLFSIEEIPPLTSICNQMSLNVKCGDFQLGNVLPSVFFLFLFIFFFVCFFF